MGEVIEYVQMTIDDWMNMVSKGDHYDRQIKEGFVGMGYVLKQLRDSGNYDGFATIYEYAEKRWGYKKTTTHNLMRINDEYSEGGNSEYIQERYAGYGQGRLVEMLALSEEDRELVTPDTQQSDIRALKQLNKEIKKAEKGEKEAAQIQYTELPEKPESTQSDTDSDAAGQQEEEGTDPETPENPINTQSEGDSEPMPENEPKSPESPINTQSESDSEAELEKKPVAAVELTDLEKCLKAYFADHKEMLFDVWELIDNQVQNPATIAKIADIMSPTGSSTVKSGLSMIFFYGSDKGCKYKRLRDIQELTWAEMRDRIELFFNKYLDWWDTEGVQPSAGCLWERMFGEIQYTEFPKKPESTQSDTDSETHGRQAEEGTAPEIPEKPINTQSEGDSEPEAEKEPETPKKPINTQSESDSAAEPEKEPAAAGVEDENPGEDIHREEPLAAVVEKEPEEWQLQQTLFSNLEKVGLVSKGYAKWTAKTLEEQLLPALQEAQSIALKLWERLK